MKLPAFLIPLLMLIGCTSDPTLRYAVPSVEVGERIGISYRSVEVREVLLPTYAQLEEIFVETPDGALTSSSALLWADDPTRATTLELTRALSDITGARVASEPWPFDSFPEVRVEVRVEEFVASALGQFRLSGQVFVATLDGVGRDRAVPFEIAVPLSSIDDPRLIASARAQAMADLARLVAGEGLR